MWQFGAQALDYISKLGTDVRSFDEKLAETLEKELLIFTWPLGFFEKFLKCGDDDADLMMMCRAAAVDDCSAVTEEKVVDEGSSVLDQVKGNLNRGGQMMADVLFGIHAGKYDTSLRELAGKSDADFAAAVESSDITKNNALAKDLRELVRMLSNSVSSTVSADAAVPPVGLRQLCRVRSNPDTQEDADAAARERESVWKQAVGIRKRYATLSVLKAATLDGYIASFKASGNVYGFKGVLNESHRLFVMSADLLTEDGDKPWAALSPPSKDAIDAATGFFKVQTGPTDFILVLDGRQRETRRTIQDWAAGLKQPSCEVFILYQGRPVRAGRTRKTFLTANLLETGIVVLPCPANKLELKTREVHNACKESSTFHNTYTGVPIRPTAEIPLISRTEKETIGFRRAAVDDVPEKWLHGSSEPLFWQESKSIDFWQALLKDFRAKAVFDVSAGSGALAEAALSLGIGYHGLCRGLGWQDFA